MLLHFTLVSKNWYYCNDGETVKRNSPQLNLAIQGAKLMDQGILDYESFNLVLWSMAFGASGMGQAAK